MKCSGFFIVGHVVDFRGASGVGRQFVGEVVESTRRLWGSHPSLSDFLYGITGKRILLGIRDVEFPHDAVGSRRLISKKVASKHSITRTPRPSLSQFVAWQDLMTIWCLVMRVIIFGFTAHAPRKASDTDSNCYPLRYEPPERELFRCPMQQLTWYLENISGSKRHTVCRNERGGYSFGLSVLSIDHPIPNVKFGRPFKEKLSSSRNHWELASEGYSLALGDITSNQGRLKEVADECTEICKNTLAHEAEPKLYYGPCDVTAEPQVQALVQAAVDDLGGIDVMVANAGIYRVAPLLEMEDELFDQVYTVNVKGLLYSYRAAARAMIPRGGGRIIGACSASGRLASPNKGAYCSSKFAVRALTQTAALEWGRHNITVNQIGNKDVLGGITGGNQAQQLIVDRLATGNISSPDEIAGLVSFLVSPAARNITGQAISIDGGLIMQ
ncbi:short chain dehydrogenase domain-containing protein [Rhizoctonia solani AG-1 IA]|uniref:3-oxoacyl-[acyl-carrier-protein] reductase n=1 Tax=Thanatephorus cucumeris (strain AG1-IA) TaxID=983506 RepID=L8X0X5_THACA|nr:short chain dehydrogenase domain-containing protein [Rhizoctonia solani AG-1 IA]